MKRNIIIFTILIVVFASAFSASINLKDMYIGWFRPSDLNTWTTPWMLPVLYKEATNTTVINAYYRKESGSDTLNVLGAYAFYKFIGGDYMRATVKASYTTFTINRYTVGIAVPNAGFDVRYTSVMDGESQYYSEAGMDIEYMWPWTMFGFLTNTNGSGSRIFSYVKLSNFVRYIKPAYPTNSSWQPVFSFNYLLRTVWTLPQFALIYDQYSGLEATSYQPKTYDYNAIEILFKPTKNLILRGGVDFENSGSSAIPSVNAGAKFTFKNFNINADYQQVLSENEATFAISGGINF